MNKSVGKDLLSAASLEEKNTDGKREQLPYFISKPRETHPPACSLIYKTLKNSFMFDLDQKE